MMTQENEVFMAFKVFLALFWVCVFLSKGFGSDHFHNAPPKTSELRNPFRPHDSKVLENGKKLFVKNCVSCHGRDAMGSGNIPSLARGPTQSAKDGEVFWFITHGSPDNGMPPSPLSERENWQVVSFVKSLGHTPIKYLTGSTAPAKASSLTNENGASTGPFADYHSELVGRTHKITVNDLPAPKPETSASNGPEVVPRPQNVWPQVPQGFKVDLFASDLDHPRFMRTAPNGDIFVAETEPGKILVFHGLTKDNKAEKSETFATGLNKPYGIAFYPPGPNPQWIYVGDTDAVLRFRYKNGDTRVKDKPKKLADLPHSTRGHSTRALEFSADGKRLFVGVGSASNVDDPDTHSSEKNRADILVMSPEGHDVQVFASGIRNAGSGLAIQPETGELWCSVNERDALGDDLVPDYITHVEEGGFYGWPWWYMGGHQDPRHQGKHPELRSKVITPDVLIQPHHASLQLAFYNGTQFPKEFRGDIFSAQHGSWNRSMRTGYDLIRIPMGRDHKATGGYQDFMTGFVVDDGHVWGRPVGVTVARDGALLVSDDGSNSIWRISHPTGQTAPQALK